MASRLRAAALGLLLAASLAGCVSMQSGGPVLSYSVTQGSGGQSQPYIQIIAQPPGNGWTPNEIVEGFLTASASVGDQLRMAREFLTPEFSAKWKPEEWGATVFSKEPVVQSPTFPEGDPLHKAAQVLVTGTVQANLAVNGSYVVTSAPESSVPAVFELVNRDGQWRIDNGPRKLLLSSDSFDNEYQQRNLYFFDPNKRYLVPDPVYVPQQATPADLMNGLVDDLIRPPRDWLSGGTKTAFPAGTALEGDVTLDGGTATVNLGGAGISKASPAVMNQVSAQLLWTLSGSGQGGPPVQSVEVLQNGKPWIPINSQENPVQTQAQAQFSPPRPAPDGTFYYLDAAGNLLQRVGTSTQGKPMKIAVVGRQYSQIAVSPLPGPVPYLAALRSDGTLFTSPVGGTLVKRGTEYTTMSWDGSGDLWATGGGQIFMMHGDATAGQLAFAPVPVTVVDSTGTTIDPGPFTALRVAPDGVRVAIIINGSVLSFGAVTISYPHPQDARPSQPVIKIQLSPFSVSMQGVTFTSVTWYGPDNVITLGIPGPMLTEYPVNGGSSTSIPPPPGIASITASAGYALIAGVAKDGLVADSSFTGAWNSIVSGKEKAVSPTYPG